MINKQLLIILSFTSLLFVILPSYSITQSYAQNTWQHETLFTSNEKTYLYNQPADDAEVIDSLSFLTKLVVIRSVYDSHGVGWKKCIYPVNGFVKSKFLVSKDTIFILD